MKKYISKFCVAATIFAAAVTMTNCGNCGNCGAGQSSSEIAAMRSQLDSILAGKEITGQYLAKFDTLDFVVYSGQQWMRLHESHAENIKVYYPDGSVTEGIADHIEVLKKTFVFAPDTNIKQHPIAFGSGNFTAVTGIMEGTFTAPMPTADGKFIPPTGKRFKLPMATIGIWEDGVMIEEHLFWDNLAFMQQIGAM
jgi:hypothetical protein